MLTGVPSGRETALPRVLANQLRARRRVLLDELRARARERYQPAYEIAKAALGAGRKEDALDWLERALGDRAHSMVFLKVDPQLAPLREEERFRELARKVGLPRAPATSSAPRSARPAPPSPAGPER